MTRLKVGSKISRLMDAMDNNWKNTCSKHLELADGVFTVNYVSPSGSFIGIAELPDDNDSYPFAAKNFHLEKVKPEIVVGSKVVRKPEYQDPCWIKYCKDVGKLPNEIMTVESMSSKDNFLDIEGIETKHIHAWEKSTFDLVEEQGTMNNVELETYYKRKPEYQDDASWKLLCKEYNFKTDDCFKLGKVINKNVMTLKEFGKSLIFEMSYFDNVASPNQHKHLELIRIFAKKAETSKTPWEGFQYKTLSGQWVECVNAPVFNENNEYRYCPEEVIKYGDKFALRTELVAFDYTKPLYLEVDSNFILDGIVRVTFEALGNHYNANILKADLLRDYRKVSN